MKTIHISDITLREIGMVRSAALSFKERVEIARALDRLQVDTVELPAIKDTKADMLSNKTIASVVGLAQLSAAAGLTEESVEQTWESIKGARCPALHIMAPVSPVQMEYMCHKKGPAILELVKALVAKARYYTERVEFSALDATRAESAFLYEVLTAAVEAGAGRVTLCDSAGIMTAFECAGFVRDALEKVPALSGVELGVELCDGMKMAAACAAAAVEAGASVVKTAISPMNVPLTEDFAAFIRTKGDALGIRCGLRTTELARAASQLQWMLQTQRSSGSPFDSGVDSGGAPTICLSAGDDIGEMVKVVRHLGYELSEEDNARVYESFQRIAAKKHFVSTRELDAIIASTAMQVPAAYRIISGTAPWSSRRTFPSGWTGRRSIPCSPCSSAPAPPSTPWCGRRRRPAWPSSSPPPWRSATCWTGASSGRRSWRRSAPGSGRPLPTRSGCWSPWRRPAAALWTPSTWQTAG